MGQTALDHDIHRSEDHHVHSITTSNIDLVEYATHGKG